MHNKQNQIIIIKKFLGSKDENNLIINKVNQEIELFYTKIVETYAKDFGMKISYDNNIESDSYVNDFFKLKELKIFNEKNSKNLSVLVKTSEKKIIFTDYKNYKKLNANFNSINGYKFEHDIVFFIKDELKINNDELLFYCKNNPILLFSEVSKYLINKNQYCSDKNLVNEKNYILDIRKSIFENKQNNFNIKNLYLNIKKEAKYKKLSFLTY